MEIKTSGNLIQRKGQERHEYLYLARITIGAATNPSELRKARGFLWAWESTLAPGSPEKRELLQGKELIDKEEQTEIIKWQKEMDTNDVLIRYDNQHNDLLIKEIYLRKYCEFCEAIQVKYGLEND
jgi:hypothetical protein